jgi:predicted dinucleotide-binding enzyme
MDVERVSAINVQPGDIVILHVPARDFIRLPSEIADEYEILVDEWKMATGLPNKVIVVEGNIRVEIEHGD